MTRQAVEGTFSTLPALLGAAAEQLGDREAYVEVATGRRISFAELVRAADGVAAKLHREGVRPGDVVAVALAPSIDFAVAATAAARLGAVVTGINTRLGPRERAGIFERCRPAAVVHEAGASVPGGAAGISPDVLALAAASGDAAPLGAPSPEQAAVIIWTSGTTGAPKGAWFDHRNLAAAVQTAGVMTAAFDRRISGIPMAHAGYMAKLWELAAFGVTVVLTPTPWSAPVMLDILVDEQITVGAGVPTQWAKLLELPQVESADLRALRVCLVATAPAPPELVERMRTVLGCPVVVRYAMTESPSITGTSPEDPPEVQYRTVGRPQTGVTVEIVDGAGVPVPRGEVGRVRIAGPCVMRGYWEDPARTNEVLDARGRLLSTDLGRVDAAGHLLLAGRASEMYIRGGYNVYPLEVEHVLAEHPGVAAAAVVGVPRPVIGEIGVAFVVPQDDAAAGGRPPDLPILRTWVSERLADYKAPDELHLLEALPLTPMLKVDKDALVAAAHRSVITAPSDPPPLASGVGMKATVPSDGNSDGRLRRSRPSAKAGPSTLTVDPRLRQPATTRGPRAKRTIAAILDATRQIFLVRGYAGTTIDEIARVAGTSRASFYTYFPSKRDVLLALGASSLVAGRSVIDELRDFGPDWTLAELEEWVGQYLELLDEHGSFAFAWTQAALEDDEIRTAGMAGHLELCRRMGVAFAALGSPAPYDPVDLGLLTLGMIERGWAYAQLYQSTLPISGLRRDIARMLTAVVTAR